MASLDEPYLVTSYGINGDNARADEHFKLGVTSVVYRESSKSSKTGKQQSRRAIAVNTVQGNGIHLVDVSGPCCAAMQWCAGVPMLMKFLHAAFGSIISISVYSLARDDIHLQSDLHQLRSTQRCSSIDTIQTASSISVYFASNLVKLFQRPIEENFRWD